MPFQADALNDLSSRPPWSVTMQAVDVPPGLGPPPPRGLLGGFPQAAPAQGQPPAALARRAVRQAAKPSGRSWERATEALRPSGSVIDVGCGAGAASLPLAPNTTDLTAVDERPAMLEELVQQAAAVGLAPHTVPGRWPDVAGEVPPADVVVCHHVVYNVPDLDAFALALHDRARRRLVLELTALHPLTPLNPLWRMLHDLDRPTGPSAHDAAAVLHEAGLRP